jgi:antitoxin component of MazEF toxin-antitoxin module
MLTKKIVRKGTSNYVLMPKDILDMLNLKEGDNVFINVIGKDIIISSTKKIMEAKHGRNNNY